MDSRELEEHHNHRLFVRGQAWHRQADAMPCEIELAILTIDADEADLRFCGVTCRLFLKGGTVHRWVGPPKLWTDAGHRIEGSEFHDRVNVMLLQPEFRVARHLSECASRSWQIIKRTPEGVYCRDHTSRGAIWLQMFGIMQLIHADICRQGYVVAKEVRDHAKRYGMF